MNVPNDTVNDWFGPIILFLVGMGCTIYSFWERSVYFLLFGVLVIVCGYLLRRQNKTVDCYKCKESVSSSALICKHCNENFEKSYEDSYVSIWEHVNFSIKGYLQRCFWGVVVLTILVLVGQSELSGPFRKGSASVDELREMIFFTLPIAVCAGFVPFSYVYDIFTLRYNTWGDQYWNHNIRVDTERQVTKEPVKTVIHCPSCNQGLRVAVPLGKLVEITCPNSNCKKTFRHSG